MTFQFSIWDKIKDLGNLSATAITNLVSVLVHLLRTKSLPLSVLKVGVLSFQNTCSHVSKFCGKRVLLAVCT